MLFHNYQHMHRVIHRLFHRNKNSNPLRLLLFYIILYIIINFANGKKLLNLKNAKFSNLNNNVVMKVLLLLLFLIFNLTTVIAQHQTLDISGKWMSSLGACVLPGTTDENKLGDGKHPTDVTAQLTRLYPYEGVVSYERDIVLPKSMEGQQLLLCLERTKKTEVFIDGKSFGSQMGIYAKQIYEIGTLKAGSHHIRIDVDNRAESFPQGIQGSHEPPQAH